MVLRRYVAADSSLASSRSLLGAFIRVGWRCELHLLSKSGSERDNQRTTYSYIHTSGSDVQHLHYIHDHLACTIVLLLLLLLLLLKVYYIYEHICSAWKTYMYTTFAH
jgi:hypothetical protein